MDEAWPSQTRARESPRPRPQTRRSRPRAPTAWRKCGQAWHSVGKLWLGGVFSRDLFTIQSWCEKVLGTSYLEPSNKTLSLGALLSAPLRCRGAASQQPVEGDGDGLEMLYGLPEIVVVGVTQL